MDNNSVITLITQKQVKKTINVFEEKLQMIISKEKFSIIRDGDAVKAIQESVYNNIKEEQQKGNFSKFENMINAFKSTKTILKSSFSEEELYVVIMFREKFIVITIKFVNVLFFLIELFQLTEGDLVITNKDFSKGLCLESNHLHGKDEYEVTFWLN